MARTIRKTSGPGRLAMAVLPLLASVRGVGLSLVHAPRFLPYWARSCSTTTVPCSGRSSAPGAPALGRRQRGLARGGPDRPHVTGFLFWPSRALLLPPEQIGLGSAVVAPPSLTVQLGMLGVGTGHPDAPAQRARRRPPADRDEPADRRGLGTPGGRCAGRGHLFDGFGRRRGLAQPCRHHHLPGDGALRQRGLPAGTHSAWPRSGPTVPWSAACCRAWCSWGSSAWLSPRGSATSPSWWRRGRGCLVSVLAGLRQLRRARLEPDWRHGLRPRSAVGLLRPGLPTTPLMMADRAPGYLLPLIVAATLGPATTAAWYIVWMMASAVFFVPQSAGFSLQTALAGTRSRRGLVSSRNPRKPAAHPRGRADPPAVGPLPPAVSRSALCLRMGAVAGPRAGTAAQLRDPGLLRACAAPAGALVESTFVAVSRPRWWSSRPPPLPSNLALPAYPCSGPPPRRPRR